MLQPGTPMVELFPVGQAAFGNPRQPNPPPGFGPRQVIINRQQNAEEASARRVMFETQLQLEASQRENTLRNLFSHKLLSLLQSVMDHLSLLSTYLRPLYLFKGHFHPNLRGWIQEQLEQAAAEDVKREKTALPKLAVTAADATTVTRRVHEWLQKTAMALNMWSASAVQLWHHAVSVAKAAHAQWTTMAPAQ